MAELATVARPYAEALFKSAASPALADQLDQVAQVARLESVRQFADNPKVSAQAVHDVITAAVKTTLDPKVGNLLRAVIDNGRLGALGEVAAQYRALVNASTGVSDARVVSAFPMDDAQLADVIGSLEKRFGRKLKPKVDVDPGLIGGIRVEVGDEVLDTSIKARLERMRSTLVA
jgi:F-type H+-transporting ATPase subunit delta